MEKDNFHLNGGLTMLIHNLVGLVDKDFKESIKTINAHLSDEDLLPFIINKYDDSCDFTAFTAGGIP